MKVASRTIDRPNQRRYICRIWCDGAAVTVNDGRIPWEGCDFAHNVSLPRSSQTGLEVRRRRRTLGPILVGLGVFGLFLLASGVLLPLFERGGSRDRRTGSHSKAAEAVVRQRI